MELSATMIDGIILAVVLISALLAYSRGFVRETFTLLIWIGAAIAALRFYPMVEGAILDFTDALGALTPWAAMVVTFVLALIILSAIGSALSSAVQRSALGTLDKGLGFLFGAARGLILLAVAYMMFEQSSPGTLEAEAFATSRGMPVVADTATAIRNAMPEEMPPFLQGALDDFFDNAPGAEPDSAVPATETDSENSTF